MGFLKTAFFAFLAITAGVASARPIGAPSPSPSPAIGGDCASLGPRNMVQCCATKILNNIHDASCVNTAGSPSPGPIPPTSPSPSPIPPVSPSPSPTPHLVIHQDGT